jgi:HlyD family secretion protein
VAVAVAQIELAKKTVALAESQVAECTLTAPRSGVVMTRVREPGELALPGSSILKIGRLDEVYTWIYVPNEEVGRVHLGQSVTVVADTYPGRTFTGTVARVNEQAEFTPRSIQTKEDRTRLVYGVKVVVPNPDRALMPGMPVEAALVDPPPQAVSGGR